MVLMKYGFRLLLYFLCILCVFVVLEGMATIIDSSFRVVDRSYFFVLF